MSNLLIDRQGSYTGIIATGLRLAETKMEDGGWKEYLEANEIADLTIEDEMLRASTALMLENTKQWLGSKTGVTRQRHGNRDVQMVNEASRSAMLGGFSDYLFPIVRASFPSNPINDIVTVQPTTRRTATIVYWDWIVAKTKGNYTQGMKLFDALRGKQDSGFNFSSQTVEGEVFVTAAGAQVVTGTLAYHDGGGIAPGTVLVAATVNGVNVSYRDNGLGGWSGGVTGAIAYATGVVSIDAGVGNTFDNGTPVTATYLHSNEGSSNLPELDVQISTNTIETQRRAIIINYSAEAMNDISTEFGINLENGLITAASEQINNEVARELISIMWSQAPVSSSFPITQPVNPGYNQQQHFKDLSFHMSRASNAIHKRTQKGYANFAIVDDLASNVFESMDATDFVAVPRPANPQGLHLIGTFKNQYRIYKDIHLATLPGSSPYGNILLGWKGTQFQDAGLVYAPYRVFYSTEALTRANFITERGMASRYATKLVNPLLFARIDLGQ